MRFIFSYLKKYTGMISLVIFVKFLGSFGELMIPYILEHLIDNVVPTKQMLHVVLWGLGMIVLAILVWQFNVKANRMRSAETYSGRQSTCQAIRLMNSDYLP